MRDLIIQKLSELKDINNGFSTSVMRWQNCTFNKVPVKDVQPDKLDDIDLLEFYTLIVIRVTKGY